MVTRSTKNDTNRWLGGETAFNQVKVHKAPVFRKKKRLLTTLMTGLFASALTPTEPNNEIPISNQFGYHGKCRMERERGAVTDKSRSK